MLKRSLVRGFFCSAMRNLTYWILRGFLTVTGFLPLKVLYTLSSMASWLLKNVFKYRLEVIQDNLKRCFTDATEADIRLWTRQYYLHITDLMVEAWKEFSIRRNFFRKHVDLENIEVLRDLLDRGKSTMLVMGHANSWEWAMQRIYLELDVPYYVLYRPAKNKLSDRLMYHFRSRFGIAVTPMNSVMRFLLGNRENTIAGCLIADQNPPKKDAIWSTFLGRETPFFSGFQKLSKRFDHAVLYVKVTKVRRGKYSVRLEPITEDPKNISEQEMTDIFARKLGDQITQQIPTWLWSHRRWKYTKDE